MQLSFNQHVSRGAALTLRSSGRQSHKEGRGALCRLVAGKLAILEKEEEADGFFKILGVSKMFSPLILLGLGSMHYIVLNFKQMFSSKKTSCAENTLWELFVGSLHQ